MNEQELLDVQIDMAKAYRIIDKIPLDKFIEQTNTALTLAPLLDPTLFMKKGEDAERWLRIAKVFLWLKSKIKAEFKHGL